MESNWATDASSGDGMTEDVAEGLKLKASQKQGPKTKR
jgi:hypothetical protein